MEDEDNEASQMLASSSCNKGHKFLPSGKGSIERDRM